MKKTRMIPLIVMLIAGALACVITYFKHYKLQSILATVLVVLFIFYIIGYIAMRILNKYTVIKEPSISDEGEIIEKQPEDTEEDENEDKSEEQVVTKS